MIIISGYQGVGKSTFSKTSHKEQFGRDIKSLDYESSNYDKSNPDWHKLYVAEIVNIIKSNDIDVLFISSHLAVREALNKSGIDFWFILPHPRCKELWTHDLAQRVVATKDDLDLWNKNIRSLIGHILKYDEIIEEMKEAHPQLSESKRPHEMEILIQSPLELKTYIYRALRRKDDK